MEVATTSPYVLMPNADNPSERSVVIGPFMQCKHIKRSQVREAGAGYQRESSRGQTDLEDETGAVERADFNVSVDFAADGAKVVAVKLRQLQLYLQLDTLQELSHFFTCNFPDYAHAPAADRPSFYDSDEGNLPRFEMQAMLHDCLICFDQLAAASSKTIAFQG